MRFVYFISTAGLNGGIVRKRIGDYHMALYHGCGKYPGESFEKMRAGEWQRPALSNSNRERLHVSRSGQFVPPVSCPGPFQLVVSSQVKHQLSELQGIEFQPVVFERLVDLPLPPVADASEVTQTLYTSTEMAELIASMPDIEVHHHEIGEYFKVLMPQYYEVNDSIKDEKPVEVQFGGYYTSRSYTVPLSVSLLERHAMYRVGRVFCLTERAFELISLSLSLDYFLIGFLSLMRKAIWTPEDGIHFPPEPE